MCEQDRSTALMRFVSSLDAADLDFRESLDLEALREIDGPDRETAETILLRRVSEADDWRIPPAIAAIKLNRAILPMRNRLSVTTGRMRLALARALVDLGALARIDETVVEMLDGGDRDEGISALASANDLSSGEIVAALSRACMFHPSPEVRVNAGAKLFYITGTTKDPLVWKFRPIYLLLGSEDETVRRGAFGKICELTHIPQAPWIGPAEDYR